MNEQLFEAKASLKHLKLVRVNKAREVSSLSLKMLFPVMDSIIDLLPRLLNKESRLEMPMLIVLPFLIPALNSN